MVGLVFVSHSAELAAATKALAEQQTQGRAAIAAVGGTGDLENPFGTDAMAILDAIQSVYHDDGVLVLMDLGSAIMSAETALEFMDPDQAARVRLSAGPFVEGAMAASVQASIGMDLEAVAAEAAEAMRPKMESLGVPAGPSGANLPEPADEGRLSTGKTGTSATVTLVNHAGLHFGPAVLFVQTAAASQAEITARNLSTGAGPANAKRFNQVLSLGAEQGHDVEITAQGSDAQAALDALVALVKAGFGEIEEMPAGGPAAAPADTPATTSGTGWRVLTGIAASPGVAVGTAVVLARLEQAILRSTVNDPTAEWLRYRSAVNQAKIELDGLAERMARGARPSAGAYFPGACAGAR